MKKKILAVGAILTMAVLIVSAFVLALSPTADGYLSQEARDTWPLSVDIFGAEDKVSEVGDIASDVAINPVDVYEVEQEIEAEIEDFALGDVSFKSRKMVAVQGFTNDGNRAALIRGLWLRSTIYLSDDSTIETLTKGKLKISGTTFDVKRVGTEDDDKATFELVGPRDQKGVLTISLDKSYNEGRIKTWKGNLVIGDYRGDVELQTEEKFLRPKPKKPVVITEPGFVTQSSYNGVLEIGGKSYKLDGVGNNGPKQLDFYVYGENEQEGKFSIRLVEFNDKDTLRTYSGKILIYEVGDEDDRIEGEVKVNLERGNDNEWIGEIVIDDEVYGEERTGRITLIEDKTQVMGKTSERIDLPDIDYGDEGYDSKNPPKYERGYDLEDLEGSEGKLFFDYGKMDFKVDVIASGGKVVLELKGSDGNGEITLRKKDTRLADGSYHASYYAGSGDIVFKDGNKRVAIDSSNVVVEKVLNPGKEKTVYEVSFFDDDFEGSTLNIAGTLEFDGNMGIAKKGWFRNMWDSIFG